MTLRNSPGMGWNDDAKQEQAAWAARDGATQDFGKAKTLGQLERAFAKWSKIWDAHPEYNDYVDDEHHWDPIFWERHAELSKPKKRESNLFVAVFQEATGQPPAGWKPTTSAPPQQTLKSLQAEYKQVLQQARREAFSPGHIGASGVKVLGIHSDKDTCEHCGKKGLKKVVELDHPEHGQKACGVDCAARMVYGKTSAKLAGGITAQAEHAERIKKALAWLDEALKTKKAPIHKILNAANNLVANRGAGMFLFQYDSDPTLKVFVIGEKDIAGGRLPQREAATYNLSMLGAILQKTPQDKWRYEWPNTPGFTPADKT